jgi:hypothetical protein
MPPNILPSPSDFLQGKPAARTLPWRVNISPPRQITIGDRRSGFRPVSHRFCAVSLDPVAASNVG